MDKPQSRFDSEWMAYNSTAKSSVKQTLIHFYNYKPWGITVQKITFDQEIHAAKTIAPEERALFIPFLEEINLQ